MRVIFLGTNGWFATENSFTICTLLQCKDYDIILDAGSGLVRLPEYCDFNKPVYLFLSHYHLDHISGLHQISRYPFKNGLTIMVPNSTKSILKQIISDPFTKPFSEMNFAVKIVEIPEVKNSFPFNYTTLPMVHSSLCYGIRIEEQEQVISYCPDTGYCANCVTLAKNADLLITECGLLPGQKDDSWPHLNPETAAQIAKEANAKKLALTHFDANAYVNHELRIKAEQTGKAGFDNTLATFDKTIIELFPEHPDEKKTNSL
ncbi:MAG: ribonuclease Z [Spirochaetes bacterium]|nr:ribonuclease Z [Spirochaetota bacterium]